MESSFCLEDFNLDAFLDDIDASDEFLWDFDLESDNQLEEIDGTITPVTNELNEPPALVPDMPLSITSSSKYGDVYSSSVHEIMGPLNCSSECEFSGLRLIHLLLACAEGISENAYDLVEIIVSRLGELVSPTGSVMERVAFYLCNSLLQCNSLIYPVGHMELDVESSRRSVSAEHFVGTFSLLHQRCPYARVAHFTANQSIVEAVSGAYNNNRKILIHIIDFDIVEGLQWPPLMEALNNSNIAVGHLKITAIKWEEEEQDELMRMYSCCKHTGRRLCEHAESIGMPFSFQETDLKDVNRVCLVGEEMVIANCMWKLPHMSQGRSKAKVSDFFHAVRCLSPAILTVGMGAEFECESTEIFTRFGQGLQYSCAMFDSLEAELGELPLARAMVEKIFIGPTVMHTLLRQEDMIGSELKAANIPVEVGYKVGVITEKNVIQARALISRQGGKYYGAQVLQDGGLSLTWASVRLLSVHVWNTDS